ncbi:MAG: hypothetical protein LBN00_05435 [Oscillospiraceae bacterium]|jgi:hypothetical protein|nr:hypothetical protein [Oscillospiraceae bacterium]
MPDYKKMYFELAAKVADAVDLLVAAQQRGEETYIESEDAPILIISGEETEDVRQE